MRKIYPLFLLLLLVYGLGVTFLQAQSSVKGIVVDAAGKPLTNVNIFLLTAKDSQFVKGAVSNPSGEYVFEAVSAGNYRLRYDFTGMQPHIVPLLLTNNESKKMDTLSMVPLPVQLNEVSVKSVRKQMYEQQIDRMIINIAGSIASSGSTVLDILRRSPGVKVDFQNNLLAMNGKSGVVIMVNGKINRGSMASNMQMLAGLSSDNVEKIELISTPSANFDAEGNAGFINVVLKNFTQYGTNGTYAFTTGYGAGIIAEASINLNHRKGNLNIFGDMAFSTIPTKQDFSFYRKARNRGNTIERFIQSDGNANQLLTDGRIGLDYELNQRTTLGMLLSGFDSRLTTKSKNTSQIFLNRQLDTIVEVSTTEKHALLNYNLNLNLQHHFSEKEKMVLNADYLYYTDHDPTEYSNTYFNKNKTMLYQQQGQSNRRTPIHFWIGSADYSKKINTAFAIDAGSKATFSTFNNDVTVGNFVQNSLVTDPSLTASYTLKENIMAGYFVVTAKPGATTQLKAGLRYEYTTTNLSSVVLKNIVDRRYGNLFPSLFFAQKIGDKELLNISYSRRLTRPAFNDLAPFVIFLDPNTFFSGNPVLQPAIANAAKLEYHLKKGIFSVSYTHEANTITDYAPHIDSVTNQQTLIAENQKGTQTLNINISIPVKVKPWWSNQYNLTANWQQLDATYIGLPYKIDQKSFTINTTQSFSLPHNYSVEITGQYQSEGLYGMYHVLAFSSANFGVQKKLKRGTLRLAVTDIFGVPVYVSTIDNPSQNQVVNGNLRFARTSGRLTYTHNFGNTSVREKRNWSTRSEEEKGRVNN